MKITTLVFIVGLMLVAASSATEKRVGIIYTYQGLSSDPKSTSGVNLGSKWLETDTGLEYLFNGSAWVLDTTSKTSSSDTLSALGPLPAIGVNGFMNATFALYDSLNTNTSITVRPEGFITGLGWGPIDAENDTTQITTTGVWYRNYSSVAGLDSLRLRYFSKAGSAVSYLTSKIKLWNPYK